MQHEVLLRRTGIVTNTDLCTAPALQRTAPQGLRAALRPANAPAARGYAPPIAFLMAARPSCWAVQLRPQGMAPSTTRSWPLMKEDSSLARNTAACAMSSGRPARWIGCAVL